MGGLHHTAVLGRLQVSATSQTLMSGRTIPATPAPSPQVISGGHELPLPLFPQLSLGNAPHVGKQQESC